LYAAFVVVTVPLVSEIASLFFPEEAAAGRHQPIPSGGSFQYEAIK